MLLECYLLVVCLSSGVVFVRLILRVKLTRLDYQMVLKPICPQSQ